VGNEESLQNGNLGNVALGNHPRRRGYRRRIDFAVRQIITLTTFGQDRTVTAPY
jgi:hypothetical protein